MEMLWSLLHPQQKIFGGMLSEALLRSAAEYNLLPIDYYKREEFVPAMPTLRQKEHWS